MDVVYQKELIDLSYRQEMLGSEADIFTCKLDDKEYIFKKLYCINKEQIAKLKRISSINESALVTPKILVKSVDNNYIGYLTEYFKNSKTLYTLMETKTNAEKIDILKKARKIIELMHQYDIIHCDLHSANILYDGSICKIIDFDLCAYKKYRPTSYNMYATKYLANNELDKVLDTFIFNIDTISIIYNISWPDVLTHSPVFENKMSTNQNKIWQKVKEKKLAYEDFLIDHY